MPGLDRGGGRRACLLGMCCFLVYLTNFRPMVAQDSIPARLLPVSLLREGNVDFDEFHWLFRPYPKPYFLNHTPSGHWLSAYSIGAPLLVAPLSLPAVWWLQAHQIDDDDVRFRIVTLIMERIGAALLASISVSLLYLALCQVTTARYALAMALVYALGTNTWAVGSQSLLQHGAAEMALAGMSLFLLGKDTPGRAVAAGAFAALAVVVRPTMVVFALLALVFTWRERSRHLPAFLGLPLVGALGLWAYNRGFAPAGFAPAGFGRLIQGGYHRLRFTLPQVDRLLGLLISPNRGLLVYTPVAALALPSAWARPAAPLRWLRYLGVGIAAYVLLYSAWVGWWGGNTYGPRFLTDVLPALALCAAATVERCWRARPGRAALVALVGWGVAVQVVGVYFDDNAWNAVKPGVRVSRRPWDLTDLQIVRAAGAGWHGTSMLPLLYQTFTDPRPALLRPIAPADLGGEISVEDPPPLRYPRGRPARVSVRLRNDGHTVWPAFSDYGFLHCRINYRWSLNGTLLPETHMLGLERNLGPGESIVIHGWLAVPALPGKYELELMLLQMLQADRGAVGGAVARFPVEVD